MPWTIEVDPVRRLVTATVTGSMTVKDYFDGTEAIAQNPDFSADFRQLVIYDEFASSKFTLEMIQGLAESPSLFSKSAKRAFVVSTDVGFGLNRMFELMKNDEAGMIRVFRNLEDALAWLGLESI